MMLFPDFDVTQTIHDYDYTKKTQANLSRLSSDETILRMDAAVIADYLVNQIETVSFKDYLKRYIYQRSGMTEPFYEVPQNTYEMIIRDSFLERNVPFTLENNSRKPSQIIRKWLTQTTIRRENVFLLGFGLGMDAADVSMFLQKVIKEEDFILTDPFEHASYEGLKAHKTWAETMEQKPAFSGRIYPTTHNAIWESLLAESKESIKENMKFIMDDMETVSDTMVERTLYSALPLDSHGNLSTAGRFFRNHLAPVRLSRQRMSLLKAGKTRVCRYDILSLVFLICAIAEVSTPQQKLALFIQKSNEILKQCNMKEIYPVNPFEAVLLLCMLTEDPLETYEDLWEVVS